MNTTYEPKDIRSYLQNELVGRCGRNPKYSLRAFAKNLGIYHATLSALIAGRRPFTEKSIRQICKALQLSPDLTAAFSKGQKADHVYQELTLDIFAATSEWYYDAILELTHTRKFKPDHKWVARSLGISVNEVNVAVERLVRLDMLRINKKQWVDVSRNMTTIVHNDFTSAALIKYQMKILELSLKSLEQTPKTLRDHTSMTVAIQLKDLKEVKERLKKFRRELTAYLERPGVCADEVYQMAFSVFPLTPINLER